MLPIRPRSRVTGTRTAAAEGPSVIDRSSSRHAESDHTFAGACGALAHCAVSLWLSARSTGGRRAPLALVETEPERHPANAQADAIAAHTVAPGHDALAT